MFKLFSPVLQVDSLHREYYDYSRSEEGQWEQRKGCSWKYRERRSIYRIGPPKENDLSEENESFAT